MVYFTAELLHVGFRSEVDPTGSLWYITALGIYAFAAVLKLTLPGHYGISRIVHISAAACSEVDPTGSLWYTRASKRYKINLLDALLFS